MKLEAPDQQEMPLASHIMKWITFPEHEEFIIQVTSGKLGKLHNSPHQIIGKCNYLLVMEKTENS